ncbi:MAG: GxxExxY protein [Candidatus Sumerlaeia bacterium]
MLVHEELTETVIGAAIEVHRHTGPGLLESAYEKCLCKELEIRGIPFRKQVPIEITYKDILLDCGYRLDLLVDEKVAVEIKSVQQLENIHQAQLMTYMKLGGWNVGLLMNFNSEYMKQGIIRRVL